MPCGSALESSGEGMWHLTQKSALGRLCTYIEPAAPISLAVGHGERGAQGTIYNVADGLEARAADGPRTCVKRERLAVQPVEHDVAAEVEEHVDGGGEQ